MSFRQTSTTNEVIELADEDADQIVDDVDRYLAAKEYVEEHKPYWMNLRAPRNGELYWDLSTIFPDWHYRQGIQSFDDDNLRSDGGYHDLHNGKQRATVYYWLNPETGSALEHTTVGDEQTIPFFAEQDQAKDYLEKRAEQSADTDYSELSLYKARVRKVGDAVEVLTDQAGIGDFAPDGGTPLQIPTHRPEEVYFWYDPSLDSILQEEIEPYTMKGVFETKTDAEQFLDWYADQYDLDDTSHLELYRAELTLEGYGRKYHQEDPASGHDPPPQTDIDDW